MFAYRLAKELGYANVDVMLEEMDAGQVAEWMAFGKLEEEAMRKAELQAKAESNVKSYKRRGR